MQTRKLGPFEISALGVGCMSLSHAYGTPPDAETAGKVLLKALDLGYRFIDTAALYGFGANETLIGNVLKARRGGTNADALVQMIAPAQRYLSVRPWRVASVDLNARLASGYASAARAVIVVLPQDSQPYRVLTWTIVRATTQG